VTTLGEAETALAAQAAAGSDPGPYRSREHAQRSISAVRHAAGGMVSEDQVGAEAIRVALAGAGVEVSDYEQQVVDRLCADYPDRMIDPPDAQVLAGWIRRAGEGKRA
jgi:hypothetical protein